MSIDRLDFDQLSDKDLNELCDAQVPESLRVEYKRDLYGKNDQEKREALKDVSAFANASGGHLIIGFEEKKGLPVAITGVADVDPDGEISRLEQLILSGIEPRIQGIRIRAVPLATKSYCFVLRIPKSWYPPHRVSAQNSNRFWIRNSSGAHEASMEELRTLFTLGADAVDRVHKFRDERVREIISGNAARPLIGGGRLILHIVPLAAVVGSLRVDLLAASNLGPEFSPIGAQGRPARFNFEGFINERGGECNHGYTQIFRDGILEATKAQIVSRSEVILSWKLDNAIFEVLPNYLNAMRDLGVPPPLVVLFTLQGVQGIPYRVSTDFHGPDSDDPEPRIERDILHLPEGLVNDYGSDADYHRAVRPAFDALWNSAGFVSAQSFSSEGAWVGRRRRC